MAEEKEESPIRDYHQPGFELTLTLLRSGEVTETDLQRRVEKLVQNKGQASLDLIALKTLVPPNLTQKYLRELQEEGRIDLVVSPQAPPQYRFRPWYERIFDQIKGF